MNRKTWFRMMVMITVFSFALGIWDSMPTEVRAQAGIFLDAAASWLDHISLETPDPSERNASVRSRAFCL